MEGKAEEIRKDEQINGPIPSDIKESIGLAPDSSRLTPNTQPKVVLWGTGTPRREFLYSDDMADACRFLMVLGDEQFSSLLTSHASPLVNIGCGEDVTIAELAVLVRDVVGFNGELVFDTGKPDGTPRKLLNVDRIRNIGWSPSIDLGYGIALAYKDFLGIVD